MELFFPFITIEYVKLLVLFLATIRLLWNLAVRSNVYSILAVESVYLDFDNLPDTNFSCEGKVIGGYYADIETACQMFHVCTIGQKAEITDIKFLCLNGTVFDQQTRVCERVDEVDCSKSETFFSLNLELYGNHGSSSSFPSRVVAVEKEEEVEDGGGDDEEDDNDDEREEDDDYNNNKKKQNNKTDDKKMEYYYEMENNVKKSTPERNAAVNQQGNFIETSSYKFYVSTTTETTPSMVTNAYFPTSKSNGKLEYWTPENHLAIVNTTGSSRINAETTISSVTPGFVSPVINSPSPDIISQLLILHEAFKQNLRDYNISEKPPITKINNNTLYAYRHYPLQRHKPLNNVPLHVHTSPQLHLGINPVNGKFQQRTNNSYQQMPSFNGGKTVSQMTTPTHRTPQTEKVTTTKLNIEEYDDDENDKFVSTVPSYMKLVTTHNNTTTGNDDDDDDDNVAARYKSINSAIFLKHIPNQQQNQPQQQQFSLSHSIHASYDTPVSSPSQHWLPSYSFHRYTGENIKPQQKNTHQYSSNGIPEQITEYFKTSYLTPINNKYKMNDSNVIYNNNHNKSSNFKINTQFSVVQAKDNIEPVKRIPLESHKIDVMNYANDYKRHNVSSSDSVGTLSSLLPPSKVKSFSSVSSNSAISDKHLIYLTPHENAQFDNNNNNNNNNLRLPENRIRVVILEDEVQKDSLPNVTTHYEHDIYDEVGREKDGDEVDYQY